jgi:hypothetical protein
MVAYNTRVFAFGRHRTCSKAVEQDSTGCYSFGSIKRFKIILFFLLFTTITHAQIFDSIKVSLGKKPSIRGGLYSRYTFIDGFQKPISGIKLGLSYNNTIRFYFGGSYLKYPYYATIPIVSGSSVIEVPSEIRFWYLFGLTEFVFYKSHKWEFTVPLQLGSGAVNVSYFDHTIKYHQKPRGLFLYEPAISFNYKIFYWIGVGTDVGYRFMGVNNRKDIGIKFNSPVYTFKIIIFWGALYKKYVTPGK